MQSLEAFLNSAKEGFIYFSLGSNVKSKDLRKETLAAIMDALKAMPYKVLWKFEADILPGKPDNVKLIKWAPQKSVLGKFEERTSNKLYTKKNISTNIYSFK